MGKIGVCITVVRCQQYWESFAEILVKKDFQGLNSKEFIMENVMFRLQTTSFRFQHVQIWIILCLTKTYWNRMIQNFSRR